MRYQQESHPAVKGSVPRTISEPLLGLSASLAQLVPSIAGAGGAPGPAAAAAAAALSAGLLAGAAVPSLPGLPSDEFGGEDGQGTPNLSNRRATGARRALAAAPSPPPPLARQSPCPAPSCPTAPFSPRRLNPNNAHYDATLAGRYKSLNRREGGQGAGAVGEAGSVGGAREGGGGARLGVALPTQLAPAPSPGHQCSLQAAA